ncbi:16S rRNA methyltransferase [Amylibacter ulvae]|uniref:16S rRNA methyltransferase n=1 Tax=Paramylibacter ulvae TaxID=1651968 RepID=A0ABQ3D7S9_9RHOB|nr:transcription antitermination factor NusB [Amylibacter ulvae]GHA59883.1 16S rRNA methyltransferase [Amylibacter ulvae]
MAKQGLEARKAAAKLLNAVLNEQRLLSEVLDRRDGPLVGLAPAERARAQSLATTTLRYLGRLDAVLARFLTKRPPPAVHNILRLCAAELLIDGIAPHGAVDAAVTLVKSNRRTSHFSGLTNAVARKLVADGAQHFDGQAPQHLPKEFRQHMIGIYGREITDAIEAAHEQGAPVDISLKDASRLDEFADRLDAEILPTGGLRMYHNAQISALDGFDAGDWWIQDAAATIPARCFGDLSGKRVLDLCAAPGGKTMQLAAMGADVTSLDISNYRMKRVRENLKRTGLISNLVVADAMEWEPDMQFDAILIDAPCSATGTVRRHPDLPLLIDQLNLFALVELQQAMVSKALTWLKPSGEIVFSTCSLFAEEGEDQSDWLVAGDNGLTHQSLASADLGLPSDAATANGDLRLRPDFWAAEGGMDGFFVAKFQMNA